MSLTCFKVFQPQGELLCVCVCVCWSGLNEKAEPVTWQVSGWPARILQHEMDHLDGVLYIDHMDTKTFINIKWEEHNE